VELARFDEICNHDEDISLIKIDVEGAELAVLRGMKKYLGNKRPAILIEVTNKFLKEMGDSEQDLLTFLKGIGYKCYLVSEKGAELLDSRGEPLPEQWNALFVAANSHTPDWISA
jgi:hypothetical protein